MKAMGVILMKMAVLVIGNGFCVGSRAGPAGRPGACRSQVRFQFLYRISISRPFLFENRSLVDFQIGNEGHGGDLDENGCFT